jgi:hypothetical protein
MQTQTEKRNMKTLPTLVPLSLFVALATPVAGQLFPFDRTADIPPATEKITIAKLSAHTLIFGQGETNLEVYYEPQDVQYLEGQGDWSFKTKCRETLFIEKKKCSGTLTYLISDQPGHYLFYFYQDGCFVLTTIESLPDGTIGENHETWGKCLKNKRT